MRHSASIVACLLGLTGAVTTACRDGEIADNPDIQVDGSSGAGGEPGNQDTESSVENAGNEDDPECFEHPTTHYEIINACTDAVQVEKHPELVGLTADGDLPTP